MSKLLSFLRYIFGPVKPVEQFLEEFVQDLNKEDYNKPKNFQGQKLEVESLKLVWSKKEK